ncbi:MAG: PhoH family protein [Elusimicrobiales bacterium]|nr:PhoH family protein [Elusimicrobiales bacterium]
MITKKIKLSDTEQALYVLGPQDVYLREMEKEFKVSINIVHDEADSGLILIIKGKTRNVDKTINRINQIISKYIEIKKISFFKEYDKENSIDMALENENDIIYKTDFGEIIKPKTENQRHYIKTIYTNDIIIAIGPAGTGKTFLATAVALKLLKEKIVKKIVVTRPIVESGERLGFLPGDIDEKVNPYLKPVYDNFYNLLGPEKFQIYREEDIIETLPLAYMRGRTLENSFIILDEAQNTTTLQMKMFLTRMGMNSKIVITGDITQIDLKEKHSSGLLTSLEILKSIEEIKIIRFDNSDIVRHPLVSKIIDAYEEWEKN